MEWVETTAGTVDEAKDRALDELGVDEQEAEFDVLEEPRAGLFGRTRGEARVRARVAPRAPRAKAERRERPKRNRGRAPREASDATPGPDTTESGDDAATDPVPPPDDADASATPAPARKQRSGARRNPTKENAVTEMTLTEQTEEATRFLEGLVDAFGLEGDVETVEIDDDNAEVRVHGDELGLLIGPKGRTLAAVHEVTRAALQTSAHGSAHGRVRVDIGGYRERRREALARFATDRAESVLESGESLALEPMSPPDRKVVHDTVNEIDGVRTISEGEDPRRRVVIERDS